MKNKDRLREILEELEIMPSKERDMNGYPVDFEIKGIDRAISAIEAHYKQRRLSEFEAIKEIIIQIYYEEIYPPKTQTAEELNNRKEKAINKYLGRNLRPEEFPILTHKVDKAMTIIENAIFKAQESKDE